MSNLKPIFLFSLPRSGSTFAQRVLAAHPAVATATEPHFLLPLVQSLNPWGSYSEYEHQLSTWAILEFCRDSLPGQQADYLEEIRNFTLNLYNKTRHNGETHFLDKTPRYHLIADQIIELFPEGKFVFLWRNPLAIVASMIGTFYDGRWKTYLFDFDLYSGYPNLIDAYKAHPEASFGLRYEDSVLDPEATWQAVFDYLELPFDPELLQKFNKVKLAGNIRDPNADSPQYQKINKKPLEKWKALLANPLRKAWARDYLHWLGVERLNAIGYSLDELLAELDEVPTSLSYLADDMWRMPYGRFSRVFESHMLRDKWRQWRKGEHLFMHK